MGAHVIDPWKFSRQSVENWHLKRLKMVLQWAIRLDTLLREAVLAKTLSSFFGFLQTCYLDARGRNSRYEQVHNDRAHEGHCRGCPDSKTLGFAFELNRNVILSQNINVRMIPATHFTL
jgi:hypothetical protein